MNKITLHKSVNLCNNTISVFKIDLTVTLLLEKKYALGRNNLSVFTTKNSFVSVGGNNSIHICVNYVQGHEQHNFTAIRFKGL